MLLRSNQALTDKFSLAVDCSVTGDIRGSIRVRIALLKNNL